LPVWTHPQLLNDHLSLQLLAEELKRP